MNNIVQRRQSSFKSRLATKRSWFPVIQELMQKVDTVCVDSYQAKLEQNPFAKPETEGENAADHVVAIKLRSWEWAVCDQQTSQFLFGPGPPLLLSPRHESLEPHLLPCTRDLEEAVARGEVIEIDDSDDE
ncbi:hypothetical protein B0H13DRAFT_1852095 [Mycena leptocephala]|nr:hypothetical protein B0H13DRAFT_1852095 [Mycena leptocephala]